MPRSNLVYSNEEVSNIVRGWSDAEDLCHDNPNDPEFRVEFGLFPYGGERVLYVWQAERAMRYISAIVQKYPFQLRKELAYPMWMRFSETWDDTGDLRQSMRAI